MADTEDLKSSGRQRPCGFESRPRHTMKSKAYKRVNWISGHKTLPMVERYARQNGAHIQAAIDKLSDRYLGRSPDTITQELHEVPRKADVG